MSSLSGGSASDGSTLVFKVDSVPRLAIPPNGPIALQDVLIAADLYMGYNIPSPYYQTPGYRAVSIMNGGGLILGLNGFSALQYHVYNDLPYVCVLILCFLLDDRYGDIVDGIALGTHIRVYEQTRLYPNTLEVCAL